MTAFSSLGLCVRTYSEWPLSTDPLGNHPFLGAEFWQLFNQHTGDFGQFTLML